MWLFKIQQTFISEQTIRLFKKANMIAAGGEKETRVPSQIKHRSYDSAMTHNTTQQTLEDKKVEHTHHLKAVSNITKK